MLHLDHRPRLEHPGLSTAVRAWWRDNVSTPVEEMYGHLDDFTHADEDDRCTGRDSLD